MTFEISIQRVSLHMTGEEAGMKIRFVADGTFVEFIWMNYSLMRHEILIAFKLHTTQVAGLGQERRRIPLLPPRFLPFLICTVQHH